MPELITQLANEISTESPTATLRIARITELEGSGSFRAKTNSTGEAWLNRDADTELSIGDKVWILQQGSVWLIGGRLAGGSATPIGVINPFAGASAPAGWLMCDGSAVSRTTYSALFSVIGTTYGGGNGSSTFNVPNLVNRVPVASGGSYGRGATGGASSVILTTAQLPSHDHGSAGSHTHGAGYGSGTTGVQSGSGATVANSGGITTGSSGSHTHSSVGSNQSHENMPPFLAMPYIIRAL